MTEQLKQDILNILAKNFYGLQHYPELRNNKEVVLEAVKQYGWALKYASDELRANKEVVIEAVKQDGYALRFASDELKANKEVVLGAVKQNRYALKYASDELQADKEVVLELFNLYGFGVLSIISTALKKELTDLIIEHLKK